MTISDYDTALFAMSETQIRPGLSAVLSKITPPANSHVRPFMVDDWAFSSEMGWILPLFLQRPGPPPVFKPCSSNFSHFWRIFITPRKRCSHKLAKSFPQARKFFPQDRKSLPQVSKLFPQVRKLFPEVSKVIPTS